MLLLLLELLQLGCQIFERQEGLAFYWPTPLCIGLMSMLRQPWLMPPAESFAALLE